MSDKPKLAYDVRRYMLLVQTLALDEDDETLKGALHYYYIMWGVGEAINWHETTTLEIAQELARHIIESK